MVESHNNTERLILLHFSWSSDMDISFIQVSHPFWKFLIYTNRKNIYTRILKSDRGGAKLKFIICENNLNKNR